MSCRDITFLCSERGAEVLKEWQTSRIIWWLSGNRRWEMLLSSQKPVLIQSSLGEIRRRPLKCCRWRDGSWTMDWSTGRAWREAKMSRYDSAALRVHAHAPRNKRLQDHRHLTPAGGSAVIRNPVEVEIVNNSQSMSCFKVLATIQVHVSSSTSFAKIIGKE